MRIGIFFGGQSREREISFAGGRTVYDNLNKSLFEAVPVFVDSLGNFILLNWEYIYKGTIRDFYPPVSALPASSYNFQIYIESLGDLSISEQDAIINKVGKRIRPEEFRQYFDFAFLTLHGPFGEDGNIQGLLEWYNIPYSGSGILSSAIGINKKVQKDLMRNAGFASPRTTTFTRTEWLNTEYKGDLLEKLIHQIGLPFVIKAPNQGSSIGVSVLNEKDNARFVAGVNRSLFIQEVYTATWKTYSEEQKIRFITSLADIREGIGLPVYANGTLLHHPEALLNYLNNSREEQVTLMNVNGEESILIESFIPGKEFSCIVVQDEQGKPIALPPTEIVKVTELFDYRSKYLPGMSRKVTPIHVPEAHIEKIRSECSRLFEQLQFNVYARIDGFINSVGEVFLNDPNTTSGMLPSSFFFHQAAEIGLNPSQFLTYIIRTSLYERIKSGKNNLYLQNQLNTLDADIIRLQSAAVDKIKVAVIMGGFSSERHISVESGRNIYEKLSSSVKYQPVPVFLTGSEGNHELYVMPINIMLKDNADDIKEKVHAQKEKHPVIKKIVAEAGNITSKYVGSALEYPYAISYAELAELVDEVFIALHGRPGEDGAVQTELEKVGLPYNGSGVESSRITINKYETNRILRNHGISVANHALVYKNDWVQNPAQAIADIEKVFRYPIIAKPADDGCSSAVKKIKNRQELEAFAQMMFRELPEFLSGPIQVLSLKRNEEFPQKDYFLIEDLITANGARHFLEVTGGLLTKLDESGNLVYEVFEPSETLAVGEVLSLEEKFLAGEGQNITPARFSRDPQANKTISAQVRAVLEKTAKILQIEGYARIDAFVRVYENNQAETIIIEVNSLPGMTPATCIFHQTAINGYKPYHFIDAILDFGMKRKAISH
ncbi:D-alanine--D-alanine ligase [Rhodocytophaga rosea]|uniref:D-alanine--D-alanine ligase n=1 Tax=Rhodocytophaga rosea TaxID=2704465 RepID=A0A6C0GFN9_9BACT|nr:D-alanine--D-alanine ligase [Rhodocytophaga rosea]QHT66816.1 D-alanine--D-alanine ligase [Rhodocytophaga rosea]